MDKEEIDKLAKEALLDDDEKAWPRLVAEIWPFLLCTAKNVLRSDHDAEDAVQIALTTISKKRRIYCGEKFLAWANTITRNASRDLAKTRGRRQKHERPTGMTLGILPDPPVDSPDPIGEEETARRKKRLPYCLQRLTTSQREAIRLRFHEASPQGGRKPTLKSIAEKLKIKLPSLHGLLKRAMTKLRLCLEKDPA